MKQEDKNLLLKYISTALPYGVKVVDLDSWQFTVKGIDGDSLLVDEYSRFGNTYRTVGYGWKPYLRSLSSMTEEEINEFILISDTTLWLGNKRSTCILSLKQIDWLNANHFDYLGLIEKGLAIEVPKNMYN